MTLALIIAALCALYSLGYLTACVVNAPLLRVPEQGHEPLAEREFLFVVPAARTAPVVVDARGEAAALRALHLLAHNEDSTPGERSPSLHLVPPPPVPYDWAKDSA